MKNKKIYKLDNAAKIYPFISSKKNNNIFRIIVNLKQKVKPDILQQAVNDLKSRFPSFYVKLKRGLFWYYFKNNEKYPIIRKETPFSNKKVHLLINNSYLFIIYYKDNRISFECFHSLCDGYGAIEFLKAITFHYLELLNKEVKSENKVLNIKEKVKPEEIEDSFIKYYTKKFVNYNKTKKAFRIKDSFFFNYRKIGIINLKFKTKSLISLVKENNSTVTEYLTALYAYSIYKSYKEKSLSNKPINIVVPVNIRRFFESITLRNFSLYFYNSIGCNKKNLSFNYFLNKTKQNFKNEITKEKLQSNLNRNVFLKKIIFIKFLPVLIKNILIRIVTKILKGSLCTSTLSNVGNIEIPNSIKKYIKDFEINALTNHKETNVIIVVSCNGNTNISFSRSIINTKIEQYFIKYLLKKGIKVDLKGDL